MARGAFIVIEGLDRSGKTTQTDLLAARLATSSVPVERRKFPGKGSAHTRAHPHKMSNGHPLSKKKKLAQRRWVTP
jgi:thymidylate kinase